MGGCTLGAAPQLTACAELSYFGPRGWGFRASAGYAGLRYVEPVPLRRTARIARQGGITREMFDAFTHQERLGDAFVFARPILLLLKGKGYVPVYRLRGPRILARPRPGRNA